MTIRKINSAFLDPFQLLQSSLFGAVQIVDGHHYRPGCVLGIWHRNTLGTIHRQNVTVIYFCSLQHFPCSVKFRTPNKNRLHQSGSGFLLEFFWLRFAELARTKFLANPSAFEVDEEFLKMNPHTSKEDFERMIWERWESGGKFYLGRRNGK